VAGCRDCGSAKLRMKGRLLAAYPRKGEAVLSFAPPFDGYESLRCRTPLREHATQSRRPQNRLQVSQELRLARPLSHDGCGFFP